MQTFAVKVHSSGTQKGAERSSQATLYMCNEGHKNNILAAKWFKTASTAWAHSAAQHRQCWNQNKQSKQERKKYSGSLEVVSFKTLTTFAHRSPSWLLFNPHRRRFAVVETVQHHLWDELLFLSCLLFPTCPNTQNPPPPPHPFPHPLPDVPGYNYGGGAKKNKKKKRGGGGGEKRKKRKTRTLPSKVPIGGGGEKKKKGRRQTRTLPSKVPMKSLFRDAAELRRDRNACLAPLPHHLAKLHKPPSHGVQQPSQPAPPPPPPTPAPPPPALPPTPWQNKAASLSLSSQSRDVPARPVHSLEHEVVPELIKRAQAAAYHRSIPATRSSPVLSFLDQSRPLPARPRQQGDRV